MSHPTPPEPPRSGTEGPGEAELHAAFGDYFRAFLAAPEGTEARSSLAARVRAELIDREYLLTPRVLAEAEARGAPGNEAADAASDAEPDPLEAFFAPRRPTLVDVLLHTALVVTTSFACVLALASLALPYLS